MASANREVSNRQEVRSDKQSWEERFEISRYASDHGIAAARSYVSIIDTLIVNSFVDELYYEN